MSSSLKQVETVARVASVHSDRLWRGKGHSHRVTATSQPAPPETTCDMTSLEL